MVEVGTTLAETASSFITVQTWVAGFKPGHTSIQAAEHYGRPKSDEVVQTVLRNIMNDC